MNITDYLKFNLMNPLTVDLEDRFNYKMTMDNSYYNLDDNTVRIQQLHSEYSRTIKENPDENVWFTNIKWNNVKFRNSQDKEWMQWKFPLKTSFDAALYRLPEKEQKNKLFGGNAFNREAEQNDKLTKAFDIFPKLPSVYLMIMQAFDIITFESYISIIHSNNEIMKSEGKFIKIDEISRQQSGLGIGKYDNNSTFTNGDFYLRHLGYGVYNEILCAVFEYYCDNSDVNVSEEKGREGKQGKSFYQGHLRLNVADGNIVYGDMIENYFNNSEVNKREFIKRNIKVELINKCKGA